MTTYVDLMAGLPALHGSEPGQVRKEAATAIFCKCRGSGSPPFSLAGGCIPMRQQAWIRPLEKGWNDEGVAKQRTIPPTTFHFSVSYTRPTVIS